MDSATIMVKKEATIQPQVMEIGPPQNQAAQEASE